MRANKLPEGEKLTSILKKIRKQQKQKATKIAYRSPGHIIHASMNINGKSGKSTAVSTHKWRQVRGMTFEHKIGVLTVNETKMTDEEIGELEDSIYGKDLEIFTTTGPNPRSGGVAVVFNKTLTNVERIRSYELIPSCALLVVHPWHGAETEVILAIYAPTDKPKNGQFYDELVELWRQYDLPIPTKVEGDHNFTLDKLDRLPHRIEKCESSRVANIRFRDVFDMRDKWRNENPEGKEYTFSHINEKGEARRSRLDKICTTTATKNQCRQWKIQDWGGGLGDHRVVSVEIRAPGTPYQGKGRYSMQKASLEDGKLLEEIEEIGPTLQGNLEHHIQGDKIVAPQQEFAEVKATWLMKEKSRCKVKVGTDKCKKEKLIAERKRIESRITTTRDEELINAQEGTTIQSQIDIITTRQRSNHKKGSKLRR
ncbi:hypothetical protein C8J56DRAFT_798971, partial [Mycena floridula]